MVWHRWLCILLIVLGIMRTGLVRLVSAQAQTPPQPSQADPDNAEHVALGQQVYASFCSGCHGVNLEGQSNWQKRLPLGNFPAPPHDETGHTWHHADQWLFEVVKYGGKHHAPPRYRSAMPAYQEMLSDAEIWAVLAFIKSRWPEAIRTQQAQHNTAHPLRAFVEVDQGPALVWTGPAPLVCAPSPLSGKATLVNRRKVC
jgi:mono/diheme cytochrome c family protein